MLIRWQRTIVDRRGNVQPGAVLTIRRESDQALVKIYRDREGNEPYPTGTVTADENGYAHFYAPADTYRITSTQPAIDWRDEGLTIATITFDGRTYVTAADMIADQSQPIGTLARVSTGEGSGDYVMTAAGWVLSDIQPADRADVEQVQAGLESVGEMIARGDGPERHTDFADRFDQVIATLFANGMLALRSLLLDGSGNPIEGGGNSGVQIQDALGFLPVELGAESSIIYGAQILPAIDGLAAVVDPLGFIVAGVIDGQVIGRLADDSGGDGSDAIRPVELGRQIRTMIKHVIVFGQSLSIGRGGNPAISTTQPYENVMLSSGVRTRDRANPYDPSALVPLVEQDNETDWGETPTSAALNGVTRRAVADGLSAADWRFLGTSSGRGGVRVDQLSPGYPNGDWEATIQVIKDAKAVCDMQGLSYSVWAMAWYQGNANVNAAAQPDSTPFDYMEQWLSVMWQPMKEEIYRITGQKFSPYMFTYQARVSQSAARIPYCGPQVAQWRASRMYDDVVMVCPSYILPDVGDGVHSTNEGYWLLGEYTARAMYETMVRRNGKFRPLEPISVEWGETEIHIKFHVPRGAVTLDSSFGISRANYGFEIRDSANADVVGAIVSVTASAPDEITIATTGGLPADSVLYYIRGNVRDEAGMLDIATSPLGNDFPLHNALVTFIYSRQSGF